MKAVLKIVGFFVGCVVWLVTLNVVGYVLALIARVPLLSHILYWPSDIGIAIIVIPPSTAVLFGAVCAAKIGGKAKGYSIFIILWYIFAAVVTFSTAGFSLSSLGIAIVSIITARIAFQIDANSLDE